MIEKNEIKSAFMKLQDDICSSLTKMEGTSEFREDMWERPGGGGGRTRIYSGEHIEKGGVNFSAVEGSMPEKITKALGIEPTSFFATGVSIVLHPFNPHVPIIHMNVRYFETESGLWWFGGGIDLTPHFIVDSLAKNFHQHMKTTCDKHNPGYYTEFKKWADEYFYVKHRKETRGIGGIFFDRLSENRGSKKKIFDFTIDVGKTFIPAYKEQFTQTFLTEFSEREKEWQLHRRGRYVEFNLVWDRGTKFGLDTDGNIESILMSLPPETRWTYKYEPNAAEQGTLDKLKKGYNWVQ